MFRFEVFGFKVMNLGLKLLKLIVFKFRFLLNLMNLGLKFFFLFWYMVNFVLICFDVFGELWCSSIEIG